MTGEDTDPVVKVIRDNKTVKVLLASYNQIRGIDAEEFSRLIPSFGLILYSIGMLMTLVLLAVIFGYQAISDGLSFSDIDAGLTAVLIGFIILYIIVYQIASHINLLTGEDDAADREDTIFTIFRTPMLIVLGVAFWVVAIALRVSVVPGINEEIIFSNGLEGAIPFLGFLFHAISMDLVYIGMLLIGAGTFTQGIYKYRRGGEEVTVGPASTD